MLGNTHLASIEIKKECADEMVASRSEDIEIKYQENLKRVSEFPVEKFHMCFEIMRPSYTPKDLIWFCYEHRNLDFSKNTTTHQNAKAILTIHSMAILKMVLDFLLG